ncbi:MAG: hypothetical protein ACKVRO_17375 [Micropepsaceae bacterium]
MLRFALAMMFVFAAATVHARTLGDTQIVSEAALAKLKNNKGVTLQWLWGASPAKLAVNETPEGVMISGQQGPHNGDQLVVNGVITRIEAKTFWFKGRIAITDNETTEICVREGTYTFRIIGARRFWRLKENAANCPGRADLADYVDIRF